MNRIYATFFIFFLVLVFSENLRSQTSWEIVNVNYRFEGPKMLISYDIIKSQSGETYEIWLEVTTAYGEKITPVSVYGDVKRGVIPGRKRTIIWDTHADDIVLDEDFTLEVLGKPEGRSDAIPDSIVQKYEFPRYSDLGFGLGMDYGGVLGAKFTYTPLKYLGIFVAGGLQLGGFGWQVGAKGYLIPKTSKKGFRPNLKVMYGINAAIYVLDAEQYNELYPGTSMGPGIEIRFGRLKKNGLDVDLNFPIRSKEFYDDWENLKNNPNIEIQSDPLPFSISIGYHLEF